MRPRASDFGGTWEKMDSGLDFVCYTQTRLCQVKAGAEAAMYLHLEAEPNQLADVDASVRPTSFFCGRVALLVSGPSCDYTAAQSNAPHFLWSCGLAAFPLTSLARCDSSEWRVKEQSFEHPARDASCPHNARSENMQTR